MVQQRDWKSKPKLVMRSLEYRNFRIQKAALMRGLPYKAHACIAAMLMLWWIYRMATPQYKKFIACSASRSCL